MEKGIQDALEAVEDTLAFVLDFEDKVVEHIEGDTDSLVACTRGAEEAGGDVAKERAHLLVGASDVGGLDETLGRISQLQGPMVHWAGHSIVAFQEQVAI